MKKFGAELWNLNFSYSDFVLVKTQGSDKKITSGNAYLTLLY